MRPATLPVAVPDGPCPAVWRVKAGSPAPETCSVAARFSRPARQPRAQSLGEHYAAIRRWSPAFLDAFEFESVPASASLMRAIALLRAANRPGAVALPPATFVPIFVAHHFECARSVGRPANPSVSAETNILLRKFGDENTSRNIT